MSTIVSTAPAQATPSLADQVGDLVMRAAVSVRTTIVTVIAWYRSRLEIIRSDDRGLEIGEYVLLGAGVLAAGALIVTGIVAWLNSHAATITNTP